MNRAEITIPEIDALLRAHGVSHWGVANNDPPLPLAPSLPRAISLLAGFRPAALRGVENGPTEAYFADYQRLNSTLNTAAAALARHLEHHGHRAVAVAATLEEDDSVADWGDAGVFAHKTAATQAGLGWIGKTALFVSPLLGPKLRLATVFTDLDLPPGTPLTVGRCGSCRRCVDACPAGAGRDVQWRPAWRATFSTMRRRASSTSTTSPTWAACAVCALPCARSAAPGAVDPLAGGDSVGCEARTGGGGLTAATRLRILPGPWVTLPQTPTDHRLPRDPVISTPPGRGALWKTSRPRRSGSTRHWLRQLSRR